MLTPLKRKSVTALRASAHAAPLARTLSRTELITLGLGAIIGSGAFVLTGYVAAIHAGPAVSLSFLIAGVIAVIAGACYAELASVMPVAGGSYTYTYAALGQLPAWIVGWAAVLEYSLGAALVAISWSGYLKDLLDRVGLAVVYGSFNYAAFAVIALLTALLVRGVRLSAYATAVLVLVKVGIILLFVFFGAVFIDPQNWSPYVPPSDAFGSFGWGGVMRGAAVSFFAYVGFDAVATAAQEAKQPETDVPSGIMGSIAIAAILYIALAVVLTGLVSYRSISPEASIGDAISRTGLGWLAVWLEVGALAGLTSVLLVLLLGQARMLLAMSRDGMLPAALSAVHPRYRTPYVASIVTGVVSGLGAVLLPLRAVGELVTVGTLICFALVCAAVVLLRRTEPQLTRPFRVPGSPWVPLAGVVACCYMLVTVPSRVWLWTSMWLAIGLVVYFALQFTSRNVAVHPPS